ncbi:serine hydrolase domain-containing protein [Nonomuraea basaltis]|uniref:serine hydrolase domain-containing protein n=1 Tax=Nonomuraea basaltis TaxID=2495887 RepID=UPI00110C5A14|nr:serine hydrolase domain-containing protein [Nonomuraea basaltis]TMR89365.1 beta-lactamase family protein [Nonomuraea basaltis]
MPELDQLEMRTRVDEILNRRTAVGLAVGVVRNGSLEFFRGHGVADIGSNTPVTEDTVFRVGSITKTFTAIAVMQLWEEGLVDLDAPANDYLHAYPLVPARAGFRPATVRHLLTHTAGVGEVLHPSGVVRPLFGETVKVGRPVPSLREYYREGLRIQVEPGTTFRYTDHGFATLGQIVEDVSGQPLDRYLREHIFEPLGMADTDIVRSEPAQSRLATGYNLRSGGVKAVTDYEVVTAGAASAYSTPRDMARYIAALLGGGANQHGSVLKPTTLATMFAAHYQPDPRIPGLGLAFFRGNADGHPVIEHQGIVPGFNSQISVAPDDGVGVMAFTNGASDAMLWMPAELGSLLNHLLGVPDEVIRADVPKRPEIWGEICGWYYLPGRLTDVRARSMLGAGAEVFVRHGELVLRFLSPIPALYKGFPLHPDDDKDPYAFRIDLAEFGPVTLRVVFSREPGAGTTAVHLDVMPLSLQKQPAATNPRRWLTGALAVATTAIAIRRHRAIRRQHRMA